MGGEKGVIASYGVVLRHHLFQVALGEGVTQVTSGRKER